MRIAAIVQARMGSTRLPGKIMKTIKNKPMLNYVFDRLELSKKLDDIILATTISPDDDALEEFARQRGIHCFRGSEDDVLDRYYEAAKKYEIDIIVRITSDCPLIDPEIVDEVLIAHLKNGGDYTSNIIQRTYPRGLDTEAFNFDVLEYAYKNATEKYEREHVTYYIYTHPEKFQLHNVEAKGKLNRPDIRITVDTAEDYILIEKIFTYFDRIDFKTEEVIDLLDGSQELMSINKDVKHKRI